MRASTTLRVIPLALVLLIAAGACGGYVLSITGRKPMEPLPIYAEWWVATEACSGISGQVSRVFWFSAEVINSGESLGRGLWRPPHDIVIAKGYEEDEKTVRHEMLHDLLRGDSGHEGPEWRSCDLAFR